MGRYGVKDVFVTLQGEGSRAGSKAVFVRFSGCNLWDGLPIHRDRGEGACAMWCDTDFAKGTVMSTDELLFKMGDLWLPDGALGPDGVEKRFCVLTGGEPCLQVDIDLMLALTNNGWIIAVETNGTIGNPAVEDYADHICIAPKLTRDGGPAAIMIHVAHEIKVVLPGAALGKKGWSTEALRALEALAQRTLFGGREGSLYVQPQDPIIDPSFVEESLLKRSREVPDDVGDVLDAQYKASLGHCIAWVMANPRWRLSTQMHKTISMP